MRLGVLVSEYPAVSVTFIRREIGELRRRGAEVQTFSVQRPLAPGTLGERDRAEAERTEYLLPASAGRVLGAHLRGFLSRPGPYWSTLRLALSHRLPGARSLLWALFYFAEAIVLAADLEKGRIEHLHNHFANGAAVVGLLAAHYRGIPWSITLHGASDFGYPSSPLLGAKMRRARFVICVSHFGRAQALRELAPRDWDKVVVSRCGVGLEEIPARQRAVDPEPPVQILCVGRLAPEKGLPGLAEAFQAVLGAGADAELTLIGDGPRRAEIEGILEDRGLLERCRMLGGRSQEEVLDELSRSDILVLPSLMEGLPVVLMEAMASGVPVVAPRLAGIPELVESGESGLLFHPADWQDLARQLSRLALDPKERERLGTAGRRAIERAFVLEKAVAPLWELLNRDAGPRVSGPQST